MFKCDCIYSFKFCLSFPFCGCPSPCLSLINLIQFQYPKIFVHHLRTNSFIFYWYPYDSTVNVYMNAHKYSHPSDTHIELEVLLVFLLKRTESYHALFSVTLSRIQQYFLEIHNISITMLM